MQYINLVYGDDYEDVDILYVPDEIADNIDDTMRDFFLWIEAPENSRFFSVETMDGNIALGIDTNEFLWWLNNIKLLENNKAIIITQHTTLWKNYPIALF